MGLGKTFARVPVHGKLSPLSRGKMCRRRRYGTCAHGERVLFHLAGTFFLSISVCFSFLSLQVLLFFSQCFYLVFVCSFSMFFSPKFSLTLWLITSFFGLSPFDLFFMCVFFQGYFFPVFLNSFSGFVCFCSFFFLILRVTGCSTFQAAGEVTDDLLDASELDKW